MTVKAVEMVSVYRTTNLRVGDGTAKNPHRRLTQYWSTDGYTLLAEDDTFQRSRENDIAAKLEAVGVVAARVLRGHVGEVIRLEDLMKLGEAIAAELRK